MGLSKKEHSRIRKEAKKTGIFMIVLFIAILIFAYKTK